MSRRAPSVVRKVSASARTSSNQARNGAASSTAASSLPQPSVARAQTTSASQEENSTNIQVVIRCRGRNAREQAENSPIIVETDGPRSEEITIETALPQSTFGVYTPAPTRTYPFDRVFGPEADQALVYHDAVAPVLEEVLNGYNCTLFAYGQTGTGKTYTMQGDLSPTLTGNPSADAGIIPRALHKLFLHLENSVSDYSVKVSFVELYNEELRDLLASEFKEPSANAQPMGIASGQGTNGLKIFDDAAKKGTFIQGLEEAHVQDAKHAIDVLRKGSERRQIAATKFNDHSSRSHSIFTLTVHTKETSSDGNDLIKTGKLNLVDLAGSENIGRSGAENKRAREAGMINQSLLTLNRVITALVERSPHIPYRESKLTRLLQDSLGGRTKTCIIATVSPARCNMEETLSTLDYAFQAKAIRNRPELNSRITRNALLKEHVSEIARLKADLVAAREKNGVYVSAERWREIESAQEGGKTVREELRVQAEVAQRQSRALQEELEAQGAMLVKKTNQLASTQQELEQEQSHLANAKRELEKLRRESEEERIVREEFERNELSLDRVAAGLRETARMGVADVKGLFDKIARNDVLLSSNARILTGFSEKLHTEFNEFGTRLEEFMKSHNATSHRIKSQAESFQVAELQAFSRHNQSIDEHLRLLDTTVTRLQATEQESESTLDALRAVATRTSEGIRSSLGQWNAFISRECSSLFSELAVQQEKHISDLKQSFTTHFPAQAIKQAKASFDDGNSRVYSSINTAMTGQNTEIGRQLLGLDEQSLSTSERFTASKESRLNIVSSFVRDSKKGHEATRDRLLVSSQSLQQTMGTVINQTTLLRNSCQAYRSSVDAHASTFEQMDKALLSDVKSQATPTGRTPRKRKWDYVDSWTLTGDREDILRAWRNRDPTPSLSTSVTCTEDLKSESGNVSEQDSPNLPEEKRIVSSPELSEPPTRHESQGHVELGHVPAMTTRIARPPSLVPPSGTSRRSTMALYGNKLSGHADGGSTLQSKRLKR
ncbi:Kinesin-like protein bimC [Rhizoctonia solani AG-1 IB]|uniref:Kinesin-like protein bimC n=1 Tax=Thanatephorus cucumeris (strain AG1-IB / isolate 7/3/14) TaxID=1108050 RepID=M5BKI3_THACB|nr:Kinesin-like protein bimC [Rhizoctonia solani AG-1 IB]